MMVGCHLRLWERILKVKIKTTLTTMEKKFILQTALTCIAMLYDVRVDGAGIRMKDESVLRMRILLHLFWKLRTLYMETEGT